MMLVGLTALVLADAAATLPGSVPLGEWESRFRQYEVAVLDPLVLRADAADGAVWMLLKGEPYTLLLTPVPWNPSPAAFESSDGETFVPVEREFPTEAYRATIEGIPDSRAFLSITEAGVDGYVAYGDTNIQFQPLNVVDPLAPRYLSLVYDLRDLAIPYKGPIDVVEDVLELHGDDEEGEIDAMHSAGWHNLLEFVDSAYRSRFGGTWLGHTDNIMNRVIQIFSDEVATDWDRHAIYSCTTSTCDNDWGSNTNDSGPLLFNFATRAKAKRDAGTVISFNNAHLLSGRDFTGTTDGRGYLAGRYAISSHLSGSNYYDQVLVTHEMGHNLRGRHSDADYWTTTEYRTVPYCTWWVFGSCWNWSTTTEAYTRHHYTIMHGTARHDPAPSTGDGHYWHDYTSYNEWVSWVDCDDGTWDGLSYSPGDYACA